MIFDLPALRVASTALTHCTSFGPALHYLLTLALRFVTRSILLPQLPRRVTCRIVRHTGCVASSSLLPFAHHHPLPIPLASLPGALPPLPLGP